MQCVPFRGGRDEGNVACDAKLGIAARDQGEGTRKARRVAGEVISTTSAPRAGGSSRRTTPSPERAEDKIRPSSERHRMCVSCPGAMPSISRVFPSILLHQGTFLLEEVVAAEDWQGFPGGHQR